MLIEACQYITRAVTNALMVPPKIVSGHSWHEDVQHGYSGTAKAALRKQGLMLMNKDSLPLEHQRHGRKVKC